MIILIAVTTVNDSSREIADAIAKPLTQVGNTVEIQDLAKIDSMDGYEAAIIGSSIYFGRWQPEAIQFLRSFTQHLQTIPVWLFSTGPIKDDPCYQPLDIAQTMQLAHAREHRVFNKLTTLNLVQRLLARAIHIRIGDWRDWEDIHAWAHSIAHTLGKCPDQHFKVARFT